MKIVTWNCNGALRKKTHELDALDADVYVVQECEDPERSTDCFRDWAGNHLWVGTSKHKGLGIFAKKGNQVRAPGWVGHYVQPGVCNRSDAKAWSSADLKLFLPCLLNEKFLLLGVWTKADGADAFQYIGQLWKYLQIHKNALQRPKTIVLGDFNSNRIWDKPDRWWNHSDVVDELESIGLHSAYHHQVREAQGEESTPTFFLQRNLTKAYHIDYVFASEDLVGRFRLDIGNPEHWLNMSDHMPVTLEIFTDS